MPNIQLNVFNEVFFCFNCSIDIHHHFTDSFTYKNCCLYIIDWCQLDGSR